MNRQWYERTTAKEMRGLLVRSHRDIDNHMGRAPSGTIFAIVAKRKGLELLSEKCGHCGLQFRVTRVQPHVVDLVSAGAP